MAADDWIFDLVFEAPGGEFHVEPRRPRGALGPALALARRDGQTGAFGRTFHGFASIEPAPETVTAGTAPLPRRSTTNPTRRLPELLAPYGLADDGQIAPETPRHVELVGLEAIPWWAFDGAFGMATEVGVALGRCASTDPKEAEEEAHVLGESVAHQGELYPVTASALPFVVELLSTPKVSCRAILAGWLHVIISSSVEAGHAPSRLLAFAAKLVARDHAEAMARHQKAARDVGARLEASRPRLEALAGDAIVGEPIRAALELLR